MQIAKKKTVEDPEKLNQSSPTLGLLKRKSNPNLTAVCYFPLGLAQTYSNRVKI